MIIRGRRQDVDPGVSILEALATGHGDDFGFLGDRGPAHGGPGGAGRSGPGPELAGMEVLEDGGQSTGMVVMRMGQNQDVDLTNGAAPKVRRHNVFAGVEAGLYAPSE